MEIKCQLISIFSYQISSAPSRRQFHKIASTRGSNFHKTRLKVCVSPPPAPLAPFFFFFFLVLVTVKEYRETVKET